ncbi:MAG: hypothetical protein ACHQ0J_14035 [Candidatus Dormibacterales bacterium]
MSDTSTGFVAECFWTGVTDGDVSALDRRVETCVDEMNGDGETVRYLGSMLIPEDEVVLCFFEGSAAAVRQAAMRAKIPFERILESSGTAWPGVKPPSRRGKSR